MLAGNGIKKILKIAIFVRRYHRFWSKNSHPRGKGIIDIRLLNLTKLVVLLINQKDYEHYFIMRMF
ncbi:MAG: hypothetical protein A2Z38_02205 [Planctomycetes bacterium RBG_19FT_COMBO_48_8]|nr:MAG: hypothetical protein A2Z38_02205 [Planctomycetes bacterium RBG_19FT_COMBO_48_8]